MFEKYNIALANPRRSPLSCLACLVRFHGRETRPERIRKPSGNKGVREPLAPLQKRMCLLFGFPDSKAHQAADALRAGSPRKEAHQAGGNMNLSPPLGAFSWSGNPTENASAFEGGFSGVFMSRVPPE
jgi:hypothetical protein